MQLSLADNAFDYEKLEATPYGREIDERYAVYKDLQCLNDEDLWCKVAAMTTDERLTLLAPCLSYGLNLVEGKAMQAYNTNRRREQKDLLFEALDFDMREKGFIPDADNCFSMMTKAQVLDVIAGVKDQMTARHLSNFKKRPDRA